MTERLLIHNGTLVLPNRLLEGGSVGIVDGKIASLGQTSEKLGNGYDTVIDAEGRLICPGFIEMHTNGALGHDFLDANLDELEAIARFQAQHGTTGFLATLCTAPQARTVHAASNIKAFNAGTHDGATLLGIHLEGPYFNPLFRRVHPLEHVRVYTPDELDEVMRASDGAVRLFTLAPEMPSALEFIHTLTRNGIVAAIGHTNATYDEAMKGFDAGITFSTHTFAAMREMHHREPGAAGASLADDRITAEILSDGLHLHPAMVQLAWRAKGTQRIVIATDAMAGAGLPDGEYLLAGQKVAVKEGRTISPEGRIAGGIGTMDVAVRNMQDWLGLPIYETVRMATSNPAHMIGIGDRKGRLRSGMDADLLVCDRRFTPWLTIAQGKIVFRNQDPGESGIQEVRAHKNSH